MGGNVKINTNLHSSNRTRMTQIKRIFTDPCVSASSAQSVFYRLFIYTIVNKTDNHSALKYKNEISGPFKSKHLSPENPATGGASPGSGGRNPQRRN